MSVLYNFCSTNKSESSPAFKYMQHDTPLVAVQAVVEVVEESLEFYFLPCLNSN